MDENFNKDNWEILKIFKYKNQIENVLLIKNKNNILINGNIFDVCILKKIEKNRKNYKICNRDYIDSSKKEGIVLGEILTDHEKVVNFYGFQYDEKYTYLFLEYIEGYTLEDYILKNYLNDTEIHQITIDLLNVLNYIHSKEVIHRDLSISNFIFDINLKKWRLIDFGSSFNFTAIKSVNTSWVSTPGYYSPECFRKKGSNRKLDIWAFGCIVIKMHGGELKYNSPDDDGANKVNDKDITPEIPERANKLCKNFIKKCFFYDPIVRFDSKALNSHPYITYLNKNINTLELIEKDHKTWVELSQKRKGVVGDKLFFFDDKTELTIDTIPKDTTHLIFSNDFNKDIQDKVIPDSVKIIDFGINGRGKFNKPLTKGNIPKGLISLTLGNDFTQEVPIWLLNLKYLSLGTKRDEIIKIPPNVETFKYYGTLKEELKQRRIPTNSFNLLLPFCNGRIIENTIPNNKVNFFGWGLLKNEEEIASLKNLPTTIEDLQFSCPEALFYKLKKSDIPSNVTILIISTPEKPRERYLINLSGEFEFLHQNIII